MGQRKPYRRMMPSDYKGGGAVTFMAAADGYVMVRRPGCFPFVVPVTDWNTWPEVCTLAALSTGETGEGR